MKALLDTCTFIWLVSEPERLSRDSAGIIDHPKTELYLSDASIWEICLKWQNGTLSLPSPPRMWVEQQVEVWQMRELSIGRRHLYRVSELPQHHRDPFDRLLVAQAIEESCAVITPDPAFRAYPVASSW